MGRAQITYLEDHQEAHLPIWTEALFATELLMLHADPLYYGFGAAHGDGSGVIVIPGFLCPDVWLMPMLHWLERMGYQSFYSGIGLNNECPNLLIQSRLNETIDKAVEQTGRKVHLIGHSLGGIMGAVDCGAAFQRYRLGHHAWGATAWAGSTRQRIASRGTNQVVHSGEAPQRGFASVLHGPLHL